MNKLPKKFNKKAFPYEVEYILGKRTTLFNKVEYLVKWKNYSHEHNTWEPITNFATDQTVQEYEQFSREKVD